MPISQLGAAKRAAGIHSILMALAVQSSSSHYLEHIMFGSIRQEVSCLSATITISCLNEQASGRQPAAVVVPDTVLNKHPVCSQIIALVHTLQ